MGKPAPKPVPKPKTTAAGDLRRQLFAAYYVGECRLNATEAARRAGYTGTNAVLAVRGCRLLEDPSVMKLIAGSIDGVEATQREVLLLLASHMRGSIEPFLEFTDDDDVRFNLRRAREAKRLGLIKKLKIKKHTSTKGEEVLDEEVSYELELHDPQSAAVHLGKIMGMFVERFEEVDVLPQGDMTDEQWMEFYAKQHIPRSHWLPGVRRLFEAGRLQPAKQIESKEAEGP